MNLYDETDYSILSLIIGICAVGTIFWWYVSLPCAILTITLAWLGRNDNKKIFHIGGMLMGGLSIMMTVLMTIYIYTASINKALDQISPSNLNKKITVNRYK